MAPRNDICDIVTMQLFRHGSKDARVTGAQNTSYIFVLSRFRTENREPAEYAGAIGS